MPVGPGGGCEMRRLLVAVLAVMTVFAAFGGVASATQPATDVFVGTATTNTPGLGPIVIVGNCSSPTGYGLAYLYGAAGTATGDVAGSFTYEEHGCLFINTATGQLAGSRFDSGVFTLDPKD